MDYGQDCSFLNIFSSSVYEKERKMREMRCEDGKVGFLKQVIIFLAEYIFDLTELKKI